MDRKTLQREALSICNELESKTIDETEARLQMGVLIYEALGLVEKSIRAKFPRIHTYSVDITEVVDDTLVQLFERMQKQGEAECFNFEICATTSAPLTGWIASHTAYIAKMILEKEFRSNRREQRYVGRTGIEQYYDIYNFDNFDDKLTPLIESSRRSIHSSGLLLFQMHRLPLPVGVSPSALKREIGGKLRERLRDNPQLAVSLFKNPPKCLAQSLASWEAEHYAVVCELDATVQAGLLILALALPRQIELAKSKVNQQVSERG